MLGQNTSNDVHVILFVLLIVLSLFYFTRLYRFFLQNAIGKFLLGFMTVVIIFFVYGLIRFQDIPYINIFLCLAFWPFVIYLFFYLKKSVKIFLIVPFFSYFIGNEIFLNYYDSAEAISAITKLEKQLCSEVQFVLLKQEEESKSKEWTIDYLKYHLAGIFAYDNDFEFFNRLHIYIEKDGEIYYDKKVALDYKYFHIEKVDISNLDSDFQEYFKENNVLIYIEGAFLPSAFKEFMIKGSFFTIGMENDNDRFITSDRCVISLYYIFYFMLYACLFVLVGMLKDKKDELEKIQHELEDKNIRIEEQNEELSVQQDMLISQNEALQENKQQLQDRNSQIEAQREELEAQNEELQENKQQLEDRNNQIEAKNEKLAAQQDELERQRDELEAQNYELQEKNDKLNRFELVYNRMMNDVKKTAKYDPIQGVQVMQFSWRDFIDNQIRSGRHSLKNSVTGRDASEEELKDFEERMYKAVINPTVEKIVSQLNKTVDMIDTEPSMETTKHIYDEVCNHIENGQFKSRAERDHISVRFEYAIDEHRICYVNMHRLKAIVENLCFNTQQAFRRKRDELDDAGDEEAFENFNVSVGVVFSIVKKTDGEFLCIDYRDNATGFPEDLLPKIYKSVVPSSKGVDRIGEGTMYISFFVEAMKGFIEADNQTDADGRKCAVTRIYIPTEIEGDA